MSGAISVFGRAAGDVRGEGRGVAAFEFET